MSQAPVNSSTDLPLWVPVVVVLAALAGGTAGIWWFMATASPGRLEVVTLAAGAPGAANAAPTRPAGPNQPPPLESIDPPRGTAVTLKLESADPQAAIRELARQTGYAIVLEQNPGAPVTIDAEQQPFWPVLMEICRQTAMYPTLTPNEPDRITLSRQQRQRLSNPMYFSGGAAMVAENLQRAVVVDLTEENPPSTSLRMLMSVMFEPNLRPRAIERLPQIEEAVTAAGESLIIPQSPQQWQPMSQGQMSVVVPLRAPAEGDQRLVRLRGTIGVILSEGTVVMQIKDPLDSGGESVDVDGLEVEFIRLEALDNGGYRARFVVYGSGNDPRVSQRFGDYRRTVRLLDERNNEYRQAGGGASGGSEYALHVDFRPTGNFGPPVILEMTIPQTLRQARIPFEFTDLPLP